MAPPGSLVIEGGAESLGRSAGTRGGAIAGGRGGGSSAFPLSEVLRAPGPSPREVPARAFATPKLSI